MRHHRASACAMSPTNGALENAPRAPGRRQALIPGFSAVRCCVVPAAVRLPLPSACCRWADSSPATPTASTAGGPSQRPDRATLQSMLEQARSPEEVRNLRRRVAIHAAYARLRRWPPSRGAGVPAMRSLLKSRFSPDPGAAMRHLELTPALLWRSRRVGSARRRRYRPAVLRRALERVRLRRLTSVDFARRRELAGQAELTLDWRDPARPANGAGHATCASRRWKRRRGRTPRAVPRLPSGRPDPMLGSAYHRHRQRAGGGGSRIRYRTYPKPSAGLRWLTRRRPRARSASLPPSQQAIHVSAAGYRCRDTPARFPTSRRCAQGPACRDEARQTTPAVRSDGTFRSRMEQPIPSYCWRSRSVIASRATGRAASVRRGGPAQARAREFADTEYRIAAADTLRSLPLGRAK